MMRSLAIKISPRRQFATIFVLIMVFSGSSFAGQLKFGNWVGIEQPDLLANKQSKKIGTFAKDGISTLWLAGSESDEETIQLTLKSKKTMVSEYFSYRIDEVDTLTIRSAVKGCDFNCLTESVPRNGELIKTMKRGLQIKFEYDSYPDITRNPTFSLRGFSKAYNWLLSE